MGWLFAWLRQTECCDRLGKEMPMPVTHRVHAKPAWRCDAMG